MVVVGMDVEHLQHLVQHLAVLPSDTDLCVKFSWSAAEFFHQRCHLDGLRAGTENK